MEKTKTKWYEHRWFVIYTIISLAVSVVIIQQNWSIQRENDEIKHRLNVKDAYLNKGLIDGAKIREEAFYAQKHHNEKMLAHCKTNPCNLPPELSVLPAERRFEPIENLLINPKGE